MLCYLIAILQMGKLQLGKLSLVRDHEDYTWLGDFKMFQLG